MKCFVIMPYAKEFDDVHTAIEAAVNSVKEPRPVQCLRLDDDQRGGRIVGRLEQELRECDMCVADISGNRCNVMWEVGYAMALSKPVVLVSHGDVNPHFDLHDVQHIQYDRTQLRRTLTVPLATAVSHTAEHLLKTPKADVAAAPAPDQMEKVVSQLHVLQDMVQGLVRRFIPPTTPSHTRTRMYRAPTDSLPESGREELAGAWFNVESGSHIYARFVSERLVAPYCFGGNESLTGVYHDLAEVGNFFHIRFDWINAPISGFSLLERRSKDVLEGAWWMDEECDSSAAGLPSLESGVQAIWCRQGNQRVPKWARDFFAAVEAYGLESAMKRARG